MNYVIGDTDCGNSVLEGCGQGPNLEVRGEEEGVGVDLGEGFGVLENGVAEASEEGAVLVGEGGILEDYFGDVVFDALVVVLVLLETMLEYP